MRKRTGSHERVTQQPLGDMSRTQHKAKAAKGAADRAFSAWIRRGGVCQRCGRAAHPRDHETGKVVKTSETVQLQCAHIASRRRLAWRWDETNALCLCAGCHHWMTDYPVLFAEWLKKNFPAYYGKALAIGAAIDSKAKNPNLDPAAIAASYRSRLKTFNQQGEPPCP